jgi:hypothetical protein
MEARPNKMDLGKYKNNLKTQYLSSEYERLEKEESDLLVLLKEETMRDLAEKELENLKIQKEALFEQMN